MLADVVAPAPPAAAARTAVAVETTLETAPPGAGPALIPVIRGGAAVGEPAANDTPGAAFESQTPRSASPSATAAAATAASVNTTRRSDAVAEPLLAQLLPEWLGTVDNNGNGSGLTLDNGSDAPGLDLASALRERSLVQALEPLRRETGEARGESQQIIVAGSAASAGLSVGYVLWLARGGVLMASVLSALPAWASLDPLPVLGQVNGKNKGKGLGGAAATDDEDDEADGDAVEQLFNNAPAGTAPAPTNPAGHSTDRTNGAPA